MARLSQINNSNNTTNAIQFWYQNNYLNPLPALGEIWEPNVFNVTCDFSVDTPGPIDFTLYLNGHVDPPTGQINGGEALSEIIVPQGTLAGRRTFQNNVAQPLGTISSGDFLLLNVKAVMNLTAFQINYIASVLGERHRNLARPRRTIA